MKQLLILLLLSISIYGYSQKRVLKGTVTGETGEHLPGVTVLVEGTTIGVITNIDGKYEISVPAKKNILIYSFIGFISERVDITGKDVSDVKLKAQVTSLDEVVVVGYNTQKRVNLTGSVASIGGKELAAKTVISTSMALQGTAAGVTVTQSSGKPGGDNGTINIRGIGTLGNASPLILIDGSEGDLNAVNSNDIENISVLKDAASAAIYGSRAANGVVLITTKRAQKGKTKVDYHGYTGWQRFTGLPEYVGGYDYMVADNQALVNAGKTAIWSQAYIDAYKTKSGLYSYDYPDVNYQKLLYTGSGLQQYHNVNISGGTDKLSSMLSLAYMDQEGEVAGFNYKRYTVRINNDYKVSDKLQFKFDLNGRYAPTHEPYGGESNIIGAVERLPSLLGVYLPDGTYSTNFMNYPNAAAYKDAGRNLTDVYSISGRIAMNTQPIKGMDIELAYMPNFNYTYTNNLVIPVALYNPTSTTPALMNPSLSTLNENYSMNRTHNLHGLVTYKKAIGDHNLSILGGYEQISYRTNYFSAYRENFPFINYPVMNNGSVINMSNGGTASEWALRSYFGRFNYDFKNKYLIEANARYDGSSRFSDGHKYGFFPSFSAGWRISEESFMKPIAWISNLKLRGSWGQLGNQNIGTYPFASVVNLGQNYTFNNTAVNGAALTAMANSDITWETSTTSNVGVDFGIMNKLTGTFEYYIRNTDNILLQLPVPSTIGLTAPYQNAGKVQNKGWDFSLNYNNQDHEFKYSIGVSLSDVKNKVTDLKGSGPYIGSYTITREGDPIGALYMYKSDGLFQSQAEITSHATQIGTLAPGDIRYVDINKDGKIDANDRVVVGSNIPRYSYGFNFDAKYKGFDFNIFIQGVGKRQTYYDGYNGWAFWNFCNIQKYQLDAWTPTNTTAKMPRLIDGSSGNNFTPSDYWVHNAAYWRIKNLQIGYTIPTKLSKMVKLEKIRVYVSGNNIYTYDHLPKGWDPEQPMGNTNSYPISATYVFGIDLTF